MNRHHVPQISKLLQHLGSAMVCVFHACVHVGISEWVLTLLLFGLGRDNSVFEAAYSDSLCCSLHVDSISPLCSIDYSIDAAIFNTTVSNS